VSSIVPFFFDKITAVVFIEETCLVSCCRRPSQFRNVEISGLFRNCGSSVLNTTILGTSRNRTVKEMSSHVSSRPSPYAPPSAAIPQILPSTISLDEVLPSKKVLTTGSKTPQRNTSTTTSVGRLGNNLFHHSIPRIRRKSIRPRHNNTSTVFPL
jgi:hypothetical protein